MIKAEFMIYQDFINLNAIPDRTVTLLMKGNDMKFIRDLSHNIKLSDIYGRPLLCIEHDLSEYYIVLKNNKIFPLHVSEEKIVHLCKMYETIKHMDSLKLIMTFAAI